MEVSEQIYKVRKTSKTPPRADANRASHVRKQKGGESASPTNTNKGRTGKRKTRYAGNTSNRLTGGKTWLLHISGQSTEECKLLKYYSTKYAVQQPHKEEDRSGDYKNVVRPSSLTEQ